MNRLQTRAITLALVGAGATGTAMAMLSSSPSEGSARPESRAQELGLVAHDGRADSARNHRLAGDVLRITQARQQIAAKTRTVTGHASRGVNRRPIQHSPIATGDPRSIARAMLPRYRWSGEQFGCLDPLWTRESGWRVAAANRSGAYGIPQALPGSKMSTYGADWRTNPRTQIAWGLNYIAGRYGSPCAAWAHFQRTGWY